jgi:hypothetical protein
MGTRLGNFRKNNTEIPVLELKKYVDAAISNYQSLISLNRGFSVKQIQEIDEFAFKIGRNVYF